jgi:hypothetical protein
MSNSVLFFFFFLFITLTQLFKLLIQTTKEMGLPIHFSKFLKETFTFKEEQDTTTPNGSIHSVSPAPSIIVAEASNGGYIRDPTRCGSSQPDVVGQYYDPMGGKFTLVQGKDATYTGA